MGLKEDFTKASTDVTQLSKKPGDGDLLKLYAHYKQATEGDASGKRPGMLNLVARKKFDSWAELKGLSSTDAMQKYIDLVDRLKKEIG